MWLTAQKISKCQNRHDFCRPETMSGESVPSSFCFLLSLEARHTHTHTHTNKQTNTHKEAYTYNEAYTYKEGRP